jgi:hypothetical protein
VTGQVEVFIVRDRYQRWVYVGVPGWWNRLILRFRLWWWPQ